MSAPRWVLAHPDHCGVLYRPGEMSIPSLNHCRLDRGHGGRYHSTRRSPNEFSGFEWEMASEPSPVDWPGR